VTFNQPLGKRNVSTVKQMKCTFNSAILFSQDLGDWSVKNVTNMQFMFDGAVYA